MFISPELADIFVLASLNHQSELGGPGELFWPCNEMMRSSAFLSAVTTAAILVSSKHFQDLSKSQNQLPLYITPRLKPGDDANFHTYEDDSE
jgi:hypothetical protein